jgi:hypothetical protein
VFLSLKASAALPIPIKFKVNHSMSKNRDNSFRDLVDRFSTELSRIIAAQIERQVAIAMVQHAKNAPRVAGTGRAAALKIDGRRGGRLCPVPGCGQPGAGPRNRWFCRNHSAKLSVTEQKSILERNKRLAAEGKLPTAIPATRITRLAPKEKRARRSLDMSCRVEGCPNRSRGPRAGFICDTHRAQLSPEEQKAARMRWNDRMKGVSSAPVIASEAKQSTPPAPVPPIVRKAEQAEA